MKFRAQNAGKWRAVGGVSIPGQHRVIPAEFPRDHLRVRIEEQLLRVAAQTLVGLVWPVHAEAVALPGDDIRQVAVPDERVPLG